MDLDAIQREICEIGERLYQKGFAAANDGNISFRTDENQIVCTPTAISKGVMTPSDLCTIDLDGRQTAGNRKITSEIKLHLAILRARPDVRAVVHCHPPHATAFGITHTPLPKHVLPEIEIFLGDVPIVDYALPGSEKLADSVLPYVQKSNAMILANHGTVSFSETLERAYWWTEMLDAYCRMLILARGLGPIHSFSPSEVAELKELRSLYTSPSPSGKD